ncbi:MAG: hypothetical protein ACOCXJ_07490, partial [Planctomycetota bacterium]
MSITDRQSQARGAARADWDGSTLTITTGAMQRRWHWTSSGFATVGLVRSGGPELVQEPAQHGDLCLPGGLSTTGAELLAVELCIDDDDGFLDRHLLARVQVRHPAAGCLVEIQHRAFVGAPGLHSQASIRLERPLPPLTGLDASMAVTAESLPVPCRDAIVTAAGYYNETQRRNSLATPLLREERIPADGACDWASLLRVEHAGEGCMLVKESHKCVNQPGYDGGAFLLDRTGLRSTGWGLRIDDLDETEWRSGWAHWALAYAVADEDAAARTLRDFLRQRFPQDPRRDEVVVANTWGSTAHARDARDAAREENVLRELAIAAELGVDVIQIDDGWQLPFAGPIDNANGWRPDENRWRCRWGRRRAVAS